MYLKWNFGLSTDVKGHFVIVVCEIIFHFSDLLQISAGFESALVHLKLINFLSLVGKISR